jgi:hypothetical protein
VIIYYHRDGSQTIARVGVRFQQREDQSLEFEAVRVVELRDDGAIIVRKDRYGAPGELLSPLPLSRVHA